MTVGEVIRELRCTRGIGQKELAINLNVSIGTISNYENNLHNPDLDTLCRLADFFNVSTDFLLNQTRYPYIMDSLHGALVDKFTLWDLLSHVNSFPQTDIYRLLNYLELLHLRQDKEERERIEAIVKSKRAKRIRR